MRMNALKYVIPTIWTLLLWGCQTGRFLSEGEYLLTQNTIETKAKVPDKKLLIWDLETMIRQTPNSNLLFFFPREYFYLTVRGQTDTTAFEKWKMRALGERPALYNDSLSEMSRTAMLLYLQSKGYFDAEVTYEVKTKGGHAKEVTYAVEPRDRYLIDTVRFLSDDAGIQAFLIGASAQSLLKKGDFFDLQLFDQEKIRLTRELRNQGYANFYDNFFDKLEIDSSHVNHTASLDIRILLNYNDSTHQQFMVGTVSVFPDFEQTRAEEVKWDRDSVINNIHFFLTDSNQVHLSTLLSAIQLEPGKIYSQEDFDKTNKKLNDLGIYSFVRVRQEADKADPRLLHFQIQLTPGLPIALGADLELNYTNRNGASGAGNLLGISISPGFQHRNLLGGAERLVTNLSAGVELNTSRNARLWNTIDLSGQADLYLPRFNDYFGFWKGLHQAPVGKDKHLLNASFYNNLRENATSRISASYNYLLIVNWYRYNLLNMSYGYDFQPNRNTRYIINHIGIDYLKPFLEDPFREQLNKNPFLERSFGEQVFVSLLFRDLDYFHTSKVNRFGESSVINLRVEAAGAEIWGANALYNEFALAQDTFRLGDTIDFSQYAKVETDLRYYRQFTKERSLAARLNMGIARPFGYTSDVPYVKQFFVGGPNSIRAWAPRSLGPGGYEDPAFIGVPQEGGFNRFYQTGDVKVELNLEYRFTIFWIFKGALFVDAGNVWTYRRDDSRPGSQFLFRRPQNYPNNQAYYPFYRQIAVGSGFGLRMDLSFFIFRLDMAVKVRNPYPRAPIDGQPVREALWWNDFNNFKLRDIAFNIGLGYPF